MYSLLVVLIITYTGCSCRSWSVSRRECASNSGGQCQCPYASDMYICGIEIFFAVFCHVHVDRMTFKNIESPIQHDTEFTLSIRHIRSWFFSFPKVWGTQSRLFVKKCQKCEDVKETANLDPILWKPRQTICSLRLRLPKYKTQTCVPQPGYLQP
jgi:hypothetical protein